MPKFKKERLAKQQRHDPLEKQIRDSEMTGHLKAPKSSAAAEGSDDEAGDGVRSLNLVPAQVFRPVLFISRMVHAQAEYMSEKLSRRILDAARQQQAEDLLPAGAGAAASTAASRQALAQLSAKGLKKPNGVRALEDGDDEEDGLSEDEPADYDDEDEVVPRPAASCGCVWLPSIVHRWVVRLCSGDGSG